jgi:hypothetical protein
MSFFTTLVPRSTRMMTSCLRSSPAERDRAVSIPASSGIVSFVMSREYRISGPDEHSLDGGLIGYDDAGSGELQPCAAGST